ncbi:MAG: transcriptional regulator NrdR [Chthoniobacterales bacterium]
MRCPKCSSAEDKVIDSRLSKEGDTIRRRRECLACQNRFTTYEQVERVELRTIKRDGRHEPFDRQKLISGFIKACEKRPIGVAKIEECVENILNDFEATQVREVTTQEIGLKAMEQLHALDPVAYVRYASIYRAFEEVGEFLEEIEIMEKKVLRTPAQPELFKA